MRKRWHPRYVIAEAARAIAIPVLGLPTLVLAALLAVLAWMLWMLAWGLHSLMMDVRLIGRRMAASATTLGVARSGDGQRLVLELPPPRSLHWPTWLTWPRNLRRRHTVDDVRRSLAGMARHAWPKAEVLQTLGHVGARRAWTGTMPTQAAAPRRPGDPPDTAREQVHLRYRPDHSLIARCLFPPAEIDVWFDAEQRLVHGRIWRERIRL